MKKRALRRSHYERLKQKRKTYWSRNLIDKKSLGMISITPVVCSCYMCGNPRKWLNEKTCQEKRFELNANEFENNY